MQVPAVSVVIPMFNAEKYLTECLDSLLAQTLQNFEVIVVDDCSTDNSAAIVQSYVPHFGGRLKLVRMKKNSGAPGFVRDRGRDFSCGEYIFFLDADDMLIPSGLEEMYTLAKHFDADTVYCEQYFTSSGNGQDFINNVRLADERIQKIPPVDKPTLETNDMTVRVNKAINHHYWLTPWLKLVSRNLLIENDINFPAIVASEDINWTFKLVFCSKRFLRIPNPCYIWRINEESITTRKRTTAEVIHKWMDRTIRGLKDIDDFMADIEFFRANPVYRHAVIHHFIESDFARIFDVCKEITPAEVCAFFRDIFGNYLGEHKVLVTALCTFANTLQRIYHIDLENFNKFEIIAKRRIAEYENITRQDKAYIAELEKFVAQSQQRIAELENEVRRLKE